MTKIVFDLQLANLPVQNINLRCAGRILRCGAAAFENARRSVQQLLLPVVDLVRIDPELTRQLGDRPLALDRRQRHLRPRPSPGQALNAELCFFRVRFMSCSCATGAF